MKKTMVCLLICMLICPMMTGAEEPFQVVTSFYPVYVLTANVVEGIDGVNLSNLTAPETGCLHDYQLLPTDMRALADASVFVINGAGMEAFMDKVIAQYGTMPIIDSSEGVPLLYGENAHHHDENDDHSHGEEEANPHIWLDPRNAAIQVRNIGEGLAAADPAHAAQYRENAGAYAAALEGLYTELSQDLMDVPDRRLVTFHDAFPYFANAFDFDIVATMHLEAEEQPSTRELADMVDLVKELDIHALFAEPQYDSRTADVIAAETGAQVYVLDPVVTGAFQANAYEDTMRQNAGTLKGALAQ